MKTSMRFVTGFGQIFGQIWRYTALNQPLRRNLYGEAVLGIDNFNKRRSKANNQFIDMREKFLDRMNEYVKSENMVFTDDLKNVIYLSQNDEDVRLLVEMLKKFNSQNNELRFGQFIFGSVVMRLLHVLSRPDVVIELLKEPLLEGFFDQAMTFTIAMDLLFCKERYQDVLDIFDVAQHRRINSSKFPRDGTVLALGACYKMSTPESLQRALKILQEAKAVNAIILRKGVTFASGLALKQKDPYLALEMLNLTRQSGYFTVQNLKVVALAEMDRIEDALISLKTSLEKDVPQSTERRSLFSVDTLGVVKAAINRSQNKEHALTFQRLEQNLREYDHMSQESLDEALCSPILTRPPPRQYGSRVVGFESNFFVNQPFRQNDFRRQQDATVRQRKGLQDLDE